jgi:hypothetical protein
LVFCRLPAPLSCFYANKKDIEPPKQEFTWPVVIFYGKTSIRDHSRITLSLQGGDSFGNNCRELPAFFPGKSNGSVGQGKQRVIATAAYVGAGVYAGSPLAYDD